MEMLTSRVVKARYGRATGRIIVLMMALIPVTFLAVTPVATRQVLAQTQDARKAQADRLLQQGLKQYQTSQFTSAIQPWQQALKLYREIKDRRGEGQTLGNLGLAYRAISDYGKAIDYQLQALAIFQGLKDRQAEGQLSGNLGNAYLAIGEDNKALKYQQQSLAIAQEIKDRPGEGFALASLGSIYAELGNYAKAIESYQQSLKIARETQDRESEASTLNNLGGAYQAQGNINKAVESYQQSLKLAQKISSRSVEQIALGSLGVAYESLKEYPKAIEHHKKSLEIAQSTGDRRGEALALNNLGHTLLISGNLTEAEKNLRLAVKVLDALRSGLDDRGQVSIFDTQVSTYNLLQQILIAQNKPEAALEVSEQSRARAFQQLLATRIKPNSASSVAVSSLNIGQLQQVAKQQNATIVEYSIVPDDFLHQGKLRAPDLELLIWVVQPSGQVALQRVDLKFLRQQNNALKDLVASTRDAISNADPSANNNLKQLHQLLIQPIANLLPKDPNALVIFIPQESLFLVPFQALQDASGKYLIEQHTVITAPAIQVLNLTHQQRRNIQGVAKEVLVVGNPTMPKIKVGDPPELLAQLPGTEKEAIAIAGLLNTKAIVGGQATKVDVVKQMPNARIIHLATHGLLDDIQQLGVPGAIALAPSGNDNGFLTAGEILNLKLNAELVVLSACDTGRGEITGDGVIGLSRSLISAGVPSVVASLWAVPDDPTAALMTEFYRNFQRNPDKAQALRQAMLKTKQQYPEPLNWAAFTLIGESN